MSYSPHDIATMLGQRFVPIPEQSDIIAAPPGPLLVVAGAGAGKTETMAARVVWLVANGYVRPEQILGLTFTRKAAQQLGQRIRQRLQRLAASPGFQGEETKGIREAIAAGDPGTYTYDAYAGTLLRTYGLLLPVETTARIVTPAELSDEATELVAQRAEEFALRRSLESVVDDMMSLHGEMCQHMVDSSDVRDYTRMLVTTLEELPRAPRARTDFTAPMARFLNVCDYRCQLLDLVDEFRQRMVSNGMMDFGQQMFLAAHLAQHHPDVGKAERTNYRVVLLDEYQDTGYAQRVFLRSLFGDGQDPTMTVTAVGDPMQSIYGWRGASATNLANFRTDFPDADHQPAPCAYLLTSWRNPDDILDLANVYSSGAKKSGRQSVPVPPLRPSPHAQPADIRLYHGETSLEEYDWIARFFQQEFLAAAQRGVDPPTSAVLVTRNRDSLPMARALEAHGVPAEIVNVGGLLEVPEVQDVWAMLRIIAEPLDGAAAMRILTGSRLNLGAKDIVSLWRRARHLRGESTLRESDTLDTGDKLRDLLAESLPHDDASQVGIADALDDPGPADNYSAVGYQRITQLRSDIRRLRRRLGQPLPELIAEVEHTIGVAVEAEARLDPAAGYRTGRQHLDAFADAVASFCRGGNPSLRALLTYLEQAKRTEGGLVPGSITVRTNCVQIITVYGAKGLEWECVALPNLSEGEFPPSTTRGTWVTSAAMLPPTLRGDKQHVLPDGSVSPGVPVFDSSEAGDRKEFIEALDKHCKKVKGTDLEEKWRLMYVATTRAERALLLSGHGWSQENANYHGPSLFLHTALDWAQDRGAVWDKDSAPQSPLAELITPGGGCITVDQWWEPAGKEETKVDPTTNPLVTAPNEAYWPEDHFADSPHIRHSYARLQQTITALEQGHVPSPGPLTDDVTVLLNEYVRQISGEDPKARTVTLPTRLTASQIVALRDDPQDFARRLRRPIPFKPNRYARRGTDFHNWVEEHLSGTRAALLDIDEVMSPDDQFTEPATLTSLKTTFLQSEWAKRTTTMVEVPFDVSLGTVVLNGRIDAVFQEDENHYVVVDWKTGAMPRSQKERATKALQLAVYRIALSRVLTAQRHQRGLSAVPLENIRAAFFYVAYDTTLWLDDLADPHELEKMIAELSTSTAQSVVSIDHKR